MIGNISLDDIVTNYVKEGTTFSVVCATEKRGKNIIQLLNEHFKDSLVVIADNEIQLFPNLTVMDNIYIKTIETAGKKKKKQFLECKKLLSEFDINFSPNMFLNKLSKEEQYIVTLLKAYICSPSILILNNIASLFGHYYYNVFAKIIQGFQDYGTRIFLITTHWEDTLKFSKHVAIRGDEDIFTVFTTEEIEQNPRKIFSALAGDFAETDNEINGRDVAYAAILKGTELFVQNKELSETIKYLTGHIIEVFLAQSCIVYFVGDNGDIFHYGNNREEDNKFLLRDEYVLQCIQRSTKKMFYVSKRNQDMEEIFCNPNSEIRVLLAIPIIAIPERIGLLAVSFDRYFVYQEDDLNFLKAHCHEIGLLIQSSQLIKKSILLQEVYHRIKNNLQMIIGLIYMQKKSLRSEGKEMLTAKVSLLMDNVIDQIKSIAYVNELMIGDILGDDKVNLEMAIENIAALYRSRELTINISIDNMHIPYRMAMSICMLTNELICNACRHAFIECCDKKIIDVSMRIRDNRMYINVRDNGIGINNPNDYLKAKSIGISIIRNILRELKGKIDVQSKEGLQVRVEIPMSG